MFAIKLKFSPACPIRYYMEDVMIRVQTKPWMGREDGRIVVWVNNKVVFSKHYRNLEHRAKIIASIKGLVK